VSQVAVKKNLVLRDARVKVTAHFLEQGSVLRGTSEGLCEGFDIELSIESDESEDEIIELIQLSHQMCFTEVALAEEIQLKKQHNLNGQPIEI
jgi:uncharacterized OsmC-like protein